MLEDVDETADIPFGRARICHSSFWPQLKAKFSAALACLLYRILLWQASCCGHILRHVNDLKTQFTTFGQLISSKYHHHVNNISEKQKVLPSILNQQYLSARVDHQSADPLDFESPQHDHNEVNTTSQLRV